MTLILHVVFSVMVGRGLRPPGPTCRLQSSAQQTPWGRDGAICSASGYTEAQRRQSRF